MLSVFLTEELERHAQENTDSVLLFYFCTHQNEKRNSASAILRSLIYQLLTKNRSLYSLISSYFEDEKKTEATLTSLDALWLVLETLLRAPKAGAVLCVLDGLDECDDVSQKFIASKFSDFSHSGNTESYDREFTPIVVSRPIPGLDTFNQIKLDPDNDDYVDRDIRQLISSRVGHLQIPGLNKDLRETVKDALLRGASGTFLWVGFVMRELSSKTTCTELMETLKTLPAGLSGMYSRMLRQTDPSRRPIISGILRWVTLALEPLRLKDMALAVGLQPTGSLDISQTILDYIIMCGPIVRITGEHVSLVHQSARDYLLRREVDDDPVLECFRIDEQKVHAALTIKCLKSLETGLLIKCKKSREQAEAIRDAPLLRYAVTHWMAHAASSGGRLDWNALLKRPFFEDESTFRQYGHVARQVLGRRPIDLNDLPTSVFSTSFKAGISALSRQVVLGGTFPITSPVDVSQRMRARDLVLFCALYYGRYEIVRLFLEHGANVNTKGGGGPEAESPLMAAMSAKDISTVLTLLGHGADIQATNKKKETPLMLAISRRDTAMIRSLLARGAKTNIISSCHNTPLTLAISQGDKGVVKLLLDHGAKAEMEDLRGCTPLEVAVLCRETAMIQLLLAFGAKINAKNGEGNTPLMRAIRGYGCEETIRILLDRGANVNIKNKEGITPLMAAIDQGSPATVQLLLERGAEFDSNLALYRPLEWTMADQVVTILGLLLKYGAHVNGRYNGEEPIHAAVRRGNADAVKLLLDHGAKVYAKNKHGVTPLSEAIFYRSRNDVILELLRHGADVNAKLVGGRQNVLTGAVLNGDLEVARFLLRYGAEVNAKDRNGMTALSHALRREDEEMERLLLDHGADIPAKIGHGADALGWLRRNHLHGNG